MAFLINIIGAGNVGKTIGYLLFNHRLVTIGAVCNTSEESSECAIQFIGSGASCLSIAELPPADITLITTPDDLIIKTCEALSYNKFIKTGSIVLHCSGSLTSDALLSIKKNGCYVASAHSMKSFTRPEQSIEQYSGTYCAIEGDDEAVSTVHFLFNSIGAITYAIDKRNKSFYHAGGVFASNYLITLSQQALSCMKEAGVENEMAMHIITSLMRGTLSNLERTLSPEQALTGPIQRGDVLTIQSHVASLTNSDQKHLYSVLGKATIPLTSHNEEKKELIKKTLNDVIENHVGC